MGDLDLTAKPTVRSFLVLSCDPVDPTMRLAFTMHDGFAVLCGHSVETGFCPCPCNVIVIYSDESMDIARLSLDHPEGFVACGRSIGQYIGQPKDVFRQMLQDGGVDLTALARVKRLCHSPTEKMTLPLDKLTAIDHTARPDPPDGQ
jgi:hypothetical protein